MGGRVVTASATGLFVVPHDVVVKPVRTLSAALRRELECEPDDLAVTRLNSRTPSRIVDPETAALLECFRQPVGIVDAVLRFSRHNGRDAESTLNEAFPALQRLIGDGLLVHATAGAEEATKPSLSPGDDLGGLRIVESIQVLEDSEVLRAVTGAGEPVAVKVSRPGLPGVDRLLAREAAVLRHLDSRCAPPLLGEGLVGDRRYIAVSWVEGSNIVHASRHSLALGDPEGALDLARRLVDCYAELHRAGVVHGDVHPRNALVKPDGTVVLIDFGLADCDVLPPHLRARSRGGVGFFLEPEHAIARLAGEHPPALTPQGEQYSVAALAYLVITGSHYVRFSPEKEAMRRQIAEATPMSFASLALPPRPATEAVLNRALSKEPSQRFASMAEFANALTVAARSDLCAQRARPVDPLTAARDALIDTLLERARTADVAPMPAPFASVTYGAAGLAYGLLRLARVREDPELLALADHWSQRAIALATSEGAFSNATMEIGPDTVGRSTPYHTVSGLYWVRALISHATGDGVGFAEACAEMPASVPTLSTNPDLTLGRAGTLLAYVTLLELSRSVPLSRSTDEIGQPADILAAELGEHLAQLPPIGEPSSLIFLGIAHGWAGILYALLRWSEARHSVLDVGIVERLDQLAGLTEQGTCGLRWPRALGAHPSRTNDFLPSWCNGSAGFAHLWWAAERVTGNPRYGALALGAALDASQSFESGIDLCCGLAGRAYAAAAAFRATEDEEWLTRSQTMCRQALMRPGLTTHPFALSLYKGALGLAVASSEVATPREASMPLFEREGWPLGAGSA